ncbi:hypothetical protein ABZ714_30900 [Streptomyces sp. NPDC006798]|uniref:hypothetical protein n=1 Tax=Streptomyces sp. NPDC006798 TaxID=3155462 RepID=UPI0034005427
MASRETTPDGGSGPGTSVRRAAAVAAPAQEPATGLFPAPATTPATAPASTSASASTSTEAERPSTGTGTGTGTGRKVVDPDGTSSAAVPTTSGVTAAPAASTASPTTPTTPTRSAASAETPSTVPAPAPPGAVTAGASAAPGTTTSGGSEGAARAGGATGTRAGAMSAVRARLATAARAAGPGSGAGSGGNAEGSEPGRPNKPLIAAAVLCGLALVAVPFLISDSEEKPRKAAAKGADGSPMNTDPLGQGLVPGEERLAVPGGAKGGPAVPGKSGAAGGRGPGTGPARGPGLAGLSGLPGLGPVAGPQDGGIALPPGSAGGPASGGGPAAKAPAAPGKKSPATNPGTGSAGTKNPGTKTPTAPATKTPAKSNPPKTSPTTPPAAPATYSHLIGLGCNTPGFATGDWYEDKKEGWLKHWGSTKGNGCNGLFYSMPMSGSSKSDGIWAQWKFSTGKVEKGLCAVRVYIPNVGDNDYVGGTPAHYTVYRAFTQKSSNQIGTFRINQPSRLGQWVDAGTYRISGGKISVVLDNRGSGADNRHAAAAPVRVDCTAS